TGLAQDATPATSNLFAALGLPVLTITATDAGLSVDQAEIAAGRYLVTLNDETGNPDLATGFVRLDEGETLADLGSSDEIAAGTPALSDEEQTPETYQFLFDNYITGGPSQLSPQVVVNLPAGEYGIWPDDPFAETPVAPLTVTGDPTAEITGSEPNAAVTIVEEGEGGQGFKFTVDGQFTAGPQIVKIINASDQPHIVAPLQYPEPITQDQLANWMMFDPSTGETPPADLLDDSKITSPGYAAIQSAGSTQWVTMDLAAGQVALLCFIPDPVTGGTPHFMEGMMQVFDVG
ncbi:MAG TPA: hypothetical protein VFI12_11130, partial [Thermomicrobiales bacterium]|nr:hypothetical protein [Thermomicrobiales bacterium]